MTKTAFSLLFLLAWLACPQQGLAQGSDLYGKGIRFNLDTTGQKYIRFISWHQIWTRYQTHNPGTQVNGHPRTHDWDIGLRRSRFLWLAQISPRFLILSHFGINNQNFASGGSQGSAKKPQIFLHDMWTEYRVVKDKLSIGAGLHYWNGVSRLANASTLNLMALDAPIFNWPLIEESDQFGRQFGIYAKGKLGRIDYRLALNKPFATPNTEANLKAQPFRAQSFNNNYWASAGYVAWEFLDRESSALPFAVGTYLGTKSVFNLGFGWHYHPGATRSYQGHDQAGHDHFVNHDMVLLGVDLFLDRPLNPAAGTALTAYAGYYHYNFGPNYARSVGIMNPATPAPAGTLAQGPGNAQWEIGSGHFLYSELGYLLPKNLLPQLGRFQPFGTLAYKNLDFLAEGSVSWGIGLNYLLEGHHAKVSVRYQTRPLYSNPDPNYHDPGYNPAAYNLAPSEGHRLQLNRNPNVAGGRAYLGELVIQTMIFL
jgi:hypothetical protein